ncbi:MAG TPA: glycosyltransferase [Blastocatellia bacterium]|nr:glycosyltransferase [Blastocatellia bacterium]
MSYAITRTPEALARPARRESALCRRPRVLHLITSFEIGGTERQAVELLSRIDLRRYDVRLAALRLAGPLYEHLAARFPEVPEFPLTSFYDANAVRQVTRLRALLVREEVDILHAHDFYASLLGAAAARMAGVRVIASQRHLRLSERRLHAWGHRIIYRLADRIAVNAAAIRDDLLASAGLSPDRIVLIRNGFIPPEQTDRAAVKAEIRRRFSLPSDAVLIGVVARLQPVKGHRYLIAAARQLAPEFPQAHFIFVGDGPLRAEIETDIARFGLTERIHLFGDCANGAALAQGFDLSVLPSLHEGLPNAVIEAMAAGVPVVASAVGGVTELIADGKTGYLATPADPPSLARVIARALRSEEERARIAANGQRFITSRFSIERMVTAYERLYEELLRERQYKQRN